MSTIQNNVAALKVSAIEAPIAPAQAINQGDMVKIVANLAVPVAGATDTVIGFSDDSNPVASLLDQLSKITVNLNAPINVAFLPIKAADAPNFWDALYATADPQILTTSSGGGATKVGRCLELAAFTGDGVARAKVGLGL